MNPSAFDVLSPAFVEALDCGVDDRFQPLNQGRHFHVPNRSSCVTFFFSARGKALAHAEQGWRAAIRQINDRAGLGKLPHDGIARAAAAIDAA